jgi:HemY protein
MPKANIAVSLTQAELQMADHQLEQALATLQHLHDIAPKHTYILRLMRNLYEQLGDWEQLLKLTPELRRRKVEAVETLQQLELKTRRALLKKAALSNETNQLTRIWADQPKAWQKQPEMLGDYIRYLQAHDSHAEAETLLYQALRQHWHAELLELYAQLESQQPGKHLKQLEAYLPEHPTDPSLLFALGRISLRAKLWGKARDYLETCIAQPEPPLAAYRELGRLLEHMGEQTAAIQQYRQALQVDQNPIPLPAEIGQTTMLALKEPAIQEPAPHGAIQQHNHA